MTQPAKRITDFLTREEIRSLVEPSNTQGFWSIFFSWAMIGIGFTLVALVPNPLSVILALILIGGQQLGLAILMHECAHRSLFRTRWLNEVAGKWLCAAPVWNQLADYREHHLGHHKYTGTDRDPDLGLCKPFPIKRGSMARKWFRDLSGVAGFRRMIALLMMDFGFLTYTASTGAEKIDQKGRPLRDVLSHGLRQSGPVFLTNAILFAVLYVAGQPLLYLLWVGAYLTTYSLFVRVRSIAEHACTDETDDPFRNTRTTYASWLARLTVAPHHVNYHLEHHLLMTVPHYHLPRMHRLLKARGALTDAHVCSSYRTVLNLAIGKAA